MKQKSTIWGYLLGILFLCSIIQFNGFVDPFISSKRFLVLFFSFIPIAAYAIYYMNYKFKTTFTITWLDIFISVLLVYATVNSVLLRHHNFQHQYFFLMVVAATLYVLLKAHVANEAAEKSIFAPIYLVIMVTGTISALWGIGQSAGVFESLQENFDITGAFGNPGPYAIYLAVIAPVPLVFALNKKTKLGLKTLAIVCLVAILIILPLTKSRASWLAFAAVAGYILLHLPWVNEKLTALFNTQKKRILLAVSVLAFALLVVFLLTRFKQDSVSGRMLIWKVTTQMALDKPVFGHGLNSFTTKYNDYQALYFKANPDDDKNALLADNSTYAFNEYLNVWAEMGTVGLILFLLIFAWVAKFIFTKQMANKKNHILISEGILIAIVVSGLFSYPLHNIPVWLAFMLALVTLSARAKPVKELKINRHVRIVGNLGLLALLIYIQADSMEKYQAQKEWKNVVMEIQKGRKDMAFREYKKLKDELSYSPYFMYNYGAELCVAQRYKESLAILKKTEALLNDADFYIYIGTAFEGLGRIKKAISSFEKSSQIAPVKYYPRYKLVHLYQQTGDYMKANDMAHKILEMPVKVESETVTQIKNEMKVFVDRHRPQ